VNFVVKRVEKVLARVDGLDVVVGGSVVVVVTTRIVDVVVGTLNFSVVAPFTLMKLVSWR
jgi:hypothetical protein